VPDRHVGEAVAPSGGAVKCGCINIDTPYRRAQTHLLPEYASGERLAGGIHSTGFLFCFWIFEQPFAWFSAYALAWGPNGVFVAMTVACSGLAVVSGWLFRRGRWKSKEV
jgi:hypothetical protein